MSSELFDQVYTSSHIQAVRKYMKIYRDMGIAVIPREFMTKGNGEGWKEYQDRAPTDNEVNKWFYDSDKLWNIAAILGPTSHNLLCVDVDGEGGQRRMEKALVDLGWGNNLRGVFRHTYMTRSGSKKGFHFLVRVDPQLLDDDNEKVDAPFHRYLLFGRAKQDLWIGEGEHQGISLLSKGSLSVLAPSIHPSGKCNFYVWNNKPIQTIRTRKELEELFSILSDGQQTLWNKKKREWRKRCNQEERNNSPDTIPLTGFGELGAAAGAVAHRTQIADADKQFLLTLLLKNNRYRKGNRHKIAMGVAGYLRWHSYTKEAALKLIDFMCDFFHDEERESRRRDVEDTYAKPIEEVAWRTWLDDID
jgi:hypothetical protein